MLYNTNAIIPTSQEVISIYSLLWNSPFQNKSIDAISNCASVVSSFQGKKKVLLGYFYAMALNGRPVYVSHDYLARLLRCSRQWVIDLLKELRDMGLINWVRREYNTSVYMVAIAMLQNECIRLLQGVFNCARQAWCRKILYYTLKREASVIADPKPEFTLRYWKYLYIKNCNCTECYCSSDIQCSLVKKRLVKSRRWVMNVDKSAFEVLRRLGFTFSDAARVELQAFSKNIVLTSAQQYKKSYSTKTVDNPWLVFVGIILRICKEQGHIQDSSTVTALKIQYGIDNTAPRTLEFAPSALDKAQEFPSKGRSKKLGLVVNESRYDGDFIKHAHTPIPLQEEPIRVRLGREDTGAEKIAWTMDKLASGEFGIYSTDKVIEEKTARSLIAAAQAQEQGDEITKRKILFQHLMDVSRGKIYILEDTGDVQRTNKNDQNSKDRGDFIQAHSRFFNL